MNEFLPPETALLPLRKMGSRARPHVILTTERRGARYGGKWSEGTAEVKGIAKRNSKPSVGALTSYAG